MNKNNNANLSSLFSQAKKLERNSDFLGAQNIYKKILLLDKKNSPALTLLGLMQIKNGSITSAISSFKKAIKLSPKSADPLNTLAMVYLSQNRPDKATPYALSAYKIDSQSPLILKSLFKCFYHLNKPNKAQSYIKKAIDLAPTNVSYKIDLAQCYDTSGSPEKALEIFQQLNANGNASIYTYDGFARCQTFSEEPAEYKQIEQRIKDTNSLREKSWLHRAAAKIKNDLGHYDKAFTHLEFSKNKQLAQKRTAEFRQQVSLFKKVFTAEFFNKRKKWGINTQRPIFVFGMPRSGTTLLEQILASHPDIQGANELSFFLDHVDQLKFDFSSTESLSKCINSLSNKDSEIISKEYLQLLIAHSKTAKRVVNKMPLNFEVLWLLALLYPQATFIYSKREAMATCTSCYIQPLGNRHAYADDLEALGEYFLLHQELMEHWLNVLPINIVEVNYENLVETPEVEIKRIIAAAKIDWNDQCLSFHETKRSVLTPSRRQVELPIYKSSLNSWRRFESHLAPLYHKISTD